MSKKNKIKPMDGLGPYECRKIRNAVRQIWHRSLARKLCVIRCTDFDGFAFCEQCGERAPKITIDHLVQVGAVDSGFIKRMFCASKGLRGLCKKCHQAVTNEQNKKRRAKK